MVFLSFSTDGLPETARKTAVERMLAPHSDIRLDFTGDDPLSVSFRVRKLPGAEILSGSSAGFNVKAFPSASLFQLVVGIRGTNAVEHRDGHRIGVGPGTACLMPTDNPWTSIAEKSASFVSFALPHTLLERAGIEIGTVTRASLCPSPALPFLLSYAEMLTRGDVAISEGEAAVYAAHIQDLAYLALDGRRGEITHRAQRRGLRAARFAKIKADIKANLYYHDLSLGWLAGRHNMSPRAIRDLFYAEGTSFTDHLLGSRLDLARDQLCNPALSGQTITAIAFEAGFGDLSWFYQAFRRRFGMSPSDMRNGPRAPDLA